MTTEKFKSFETEGTEQKMMPLLVTNQVLVKPVQQTGGVALLLRSTPNTETGQPVETQWHLTADQAAWLADHLRQALADASDTSANQGKNIPNPGRSRTVDFKPFSNARDNGGRYFSLLTATGARQSRP